MKLLRELIQDKLKFKNFVFEVTPACNHNCVYCYNFWKYRDYKGTPITISDWEQIILKLKKETSVKLISISGGEPLLYPNLIEMIKFIRKQEIKVNLLTNASLAKGKKLNELLELDISIYEVSLVASYRDLHKRLKGVDDFESVIDGIANLTEHGKTVVAVFVATKYNIKDTKKIVDICIALGCKGLMFNRINPAINHQIDLMPAKEDLTKSLDYLNDFSADYGFPISVSVPIQPCIIDTKRYENINFGFCPSDVRKSYLTVDYLGNLRSCNHSPIVLGNFVENSLEELVSKEQYKVFRASSPAKCIGCDLQNTCQGGCKASAYVCYGSLSEMDPFLKTNSGS